MLKETIPSMNLLWLRCSKHDSLLIAPIVLAPWAHLNARDQTLVNQKWSAQNSQNQRVFLKKIGKVNKKLKDLGRKMT